MTSGSESLNREHARLIITKLVDEFCSEYGYAYNRIFIKNQRTRLGSCSSNRNLNFNWQIIKFPRNIMEYIIKHELAHLVHLNHSNDFWKELERLDPNYKLHHNWIRKNVQKYVNFG